MSNARRNDWFFAFFIAGRYLFSKKKRNVINVISLISMCGVCVGTLALVCVLSVFNGFESMVKGLFGAFDPDLKIESVQGKCFNIDTPDFDAIRGMESVLFFTEVLEDNALAAYKERQTPIVVKGVDANFRQMACIDSVMYEGSFFLTDGTYDYGVLGAGLANKLGVGSFFSDALRVFVPKRSSKINLMAPEKSFVQENFLVSGLFSIMQPKYDDTYLIVSIEKARTLLERGVGDVSSVELKVADGKVKSTQREIRKKLGVHFDVKNCYEQQADFFKIMQIEKWITFLILAFILLIATCNVIGSLSMLIIDKKEDIVTLHNIGASDSVIKKVFLFEGWLISMSGAVAGLLVGVVVCLSQQYFGWLKLGSGFITEAYPVLVRGVDLLLIFMTVAVMGFLAAYYPVRYLKTH